ncbi:MAG TPA: EAL domain-containing protein [Casimicrobiaceae bacterium]|nr:EAL domain-containing protein [Casimicrobiaceae bacterium]
MNVLRAMTMRSLQSRILALFLLLMVIVQVGGFVLINTVGMSAARKTVGQALVAGARVFDRLLEQDTQRIVQGARLMSADYAFREVISTGDRETIASVLVNYGKRIDASLMMVIGLDQRVLSDTLGVAVDKPFPFPNLIAQAEQNQQSSAMVLINGQLYQLVVVPVMAPIPVAWVAIGFAVNDALAQDFKGLTRLQVSFLSRQSRESWRIQGTTTLTNSERLTLLDDVGANRYAKSDDEGNAIFSDASVTRVLDLPARSGETVIAVLQEPLSSALEPFRRLQQQLALISLLAVVVSIIASVAIARGITRPVRELARVARRIAAGNYSELPAASRSDEIGELATAFKNMQQDIASRESRIMDLAYRDTLTGLPNRALFADLLDKAIADAATAATPIAVLLMDLDHFKYVNDTLGHPIGDLLLREVAVRLQTVGTGEGDVVARLGGDEFALLLPAGGVAEAQRLARAILRALELPMTLQSHVVDVCASIGIAVFPEHGSEGATLLRRADIAMYAAKRNNCGVAVWDEGADQHSSERLSLLGDLRKAVDNDELTLAYQPKVALRGAGGEHYAEALVRWRHPTRGLVQPMEFIPFAEQTGYIRAITQWVLAHAIAQCAKWRLDGLSMNVSINLSTRDLMDVTLPDRFVALLKRHRCSAQWITLEITESAVLDDPAHAIKNLERLHALGCKLAIDDYGTGYSSLAYLRRLPVHELKIDKSFVIGMATDAGDALIVRSTIELAHNLGLSVVAEGVENDATLDRLRAMGCDMVQGYLLSRAMGVAETAVWMRGSVWTKPASEAPNLRRVV